MKVFVIILIVWIVIGAIVHKVMNIGHTFETEEEKQIDLITDLIMGPLGPIMFYFWYNDNKDD